MTVGELQQLMKNLPSWTPVYAQCACNLEFTGARLDTVSGLDDGTPMLALLLDRRDVKALGKAL